jgi:hypothetical protein
MKEAHKSQIQGMRRVMRENNSARIACMEESGHRFARLLNDAGRCNGHPVPRAAWISA